MRPSAAIVIAIACAWMPACSYVFELPDSASSALSTDAGSDGSVSIVEAAPPRFCVSHTGVFCEDFDEPQAPDLLSLGTAKLNDGQIDVASVISLSPGRSFLSSVNGTDTAAAIVKALETAPTSMGLTASSDVLVAAWPEGGATLTQIEIADGPSLCDVRLVGGKTNWSFLQICSADGVESARQTTESTAPIMKNEWHRLSLRVSFNPRVVLLTVDGIQVARTPGLLAIHRAPATLTYGIQSSPSGSAVVFQDNILVTSP